MNEKEIQANIVTEPADIMPFPTSAPQQSALTTVEQQRAIQEVQASLIIARRFPRDQLQAYNNIIKACQRKDLADAAFYTYPRYDAQKGKNIDISGPTIRLAEVLLQNWGNLLSGIREISRNEGFSEIESFAWDLETNTKIIRHFQVPHIRYRKSGSIELIDPRDIYEMISNYGSRRVRDCIFRIIPGDIKIAAERECQKTLLADAKENIEDKLRDIVVSFSDIGVSKEVIENKLGHPLEATIPDELVQLRKIYVSIRDKVVPREKFFDLTADITPFAVDEEPLPVPHKTKPPRKTRIDKGTRRSDSIDDPGPGGTEPPTPGKPTVIEEPSSPLYQPPPPDSSSAMVINQYQSEYCSKIPEELRKGFEILGWDAGKIVRWMNAEGIGAPDQMDEAMIETINDRLSWEVDKMNKKEE